MRRGAGIGGIQKRTQVKQRFDSLGSEMEAESEASMKLQLEVFRTKLEEFAVKHKDKINTNPVFRAQFNKMCASIGVDPLASNKGFWAQALGVGSFYYTLAVQVVEVCLATRAENGGLISVAELLQRLRARRAAARVRGELAASDIETAVAKVRVLGNGFRLVQVGGRAMLASLPTELATDHIALLALARRLGVPAGRIGTEAEVAAALPAWGRERVTRARAGLLDAGLAWRDDADTDASGDGAAATAATGALWALAAWQEARSQQQAAAQEEEGSSSPEPSPK